LLNGFNRFRRRGFFLAGRFARTGFEKGIVKSGCLNTATIFSPMVFVWGILYLL
jgi:hypothetical protein